MRVTLRVFIESVEGKKEGCRGVEKEGGGGGRGKQNWGWIEADALNKNEGVG